MKKIRKRNLMNAIALFLVLFIFANTVTIDSLIENSDQSYPRTGQNHQNDPVSISNCIDNPPCDDPFGINTTIR